MVTAKVVSGDRAEPGLQCSCVVFFRAFAIFLKISTGAGAMFEMEPRNDQSFDWQSRRGFFGTVPTKRHNGGLFLVRADCFVKNDHDGYLKS